MDILEKHFRPCCHKDRLGLYVVFWIIGLSSDTDEVILKDAFGWCGELIEGNVVDYLGFVTYIFRFRWP